MEGMASYREIFQDLRLPVTNLSDLERSIVLSERTLPTLDAPPVPDDKGADPDLGRGEIIAVEEACLFCRADVLETILDGVVRFGNWREQGILLNASGEPLDREGRPFSSPDCHREDIRSIFKRRAEQWLIEVARRKLRGNESV